MMNLKNSLKTPFNNIIAKRAAFSEPRLRRAAVGFMILSFLGFLDASYLTAKHFLGTPLNCSIPLFGFFEGCGTVTNSKYAVIFGVPIALLGALYYLFIFVLSAVYLDTKNQKIIFILSFFPIAGFIFSLGLIYLQIFVINALCFYCVASAIISTLLFILGAYMIYCYNTVDGKYGISKYE